MKRSSEDNQLIEEVYNISVRPTNITEELTQEATPEQCLKHLGQVMLTLEKMIQNEVRADMSFRPTAERMLRSIQDKIQYVKFIGGARR